jgi:predicted PurR-regulated permease PerM
MPTSPPPGLVDRPLSDRTGGIVAGATVLALLYFARDVLIPVTLAIILSLAVNPLVRLLRRMKFNQTFSVLAAVLLLALTLSAGAAVMGVQVVRMAASLPQYEETIQNKLQFLNDMTVGRVNALASQAGALLDGRAGARNQAAATVSSAPSLGAAGAARLVTAPAPESASSPVLIIGRILASLWVPLETTGIVLVVLIFVLLEHESLRDRFIRIAGGTDIRLTTAAINDAGERLSRFFVSQFAVNCGFGATLWVGLSLLGFPHAILSAALAATLRFVPYVGIWIAAVFSVIIAAAIDPGWTLAAGTAGLFVVVELIAAQLIEPQLFGHTTGLSPLSVVIAAIFWSWLWGPIGLIVSTPLTLCLLVAGRHIKAFAFLEILLGDTQALTMPQRFYQRALSGDSEEIIASARAFLKRSSFAVYCDLVLMPAFNLARIDVLAGMISTDQQAKVREVVLAVIATLAGETRLLARRHRRTVLANSNVGRELRQLREQAALRRGGAPGGSPGCAVLCVGLGSIADDLATELLTLVLRKQKIDARNVSFEESLRDDGAPGGVSLAFVVSAYPNETRRQGASVMESLRRRFPDAHVVAMYLPGMLLQAETPIDSGPSADKAASSFAEALHICLDLVHHAAAA